MQWVVGKVVAVFVICTVLVLLHNTGNQKPSSVQKNGNTQLQNRDITKNSGNGEGHNEIRIAKHLKNGRVSGDCAVCKSGVPCEYPNEVDLRIVVLGFNRDESLQKCLDRLPKLVLNGATIAVDIWLDRKLDNTIHKQTYYVAQKFSSSWKQGLACVHVQTEHSHVDRQWLFSWRPRENTKEMILIIEDDIELSPYAAQWLLLANRTYFNDDSVYAYSLQSENVCSQRMGGCTPMDAAPEHVTFKMPILGTWGFSPKGNFWRRFQDWYIRTLKETPSYKPYVDAFKNNGWYKAFEKKGTERTMAHEMWLTHYVHNHKQKLYCIYNNLKKFTGREDVQLSGHRQETGLHYHGKAKSSAELNLLTTWDPRYANFTKDCPEMDEFGNFVFNWR